MKKHILLLFFSLLFLNGCTLTYDSMSTDPYYYDRYYWRYRYPYYSPNYGYQHYHPYYYHHHNTPPHKPNTPRHYGPRK